MQDLIHGRNISNDDYFTSAKKERKEGKLRSGPWEVGLFPQVRWQQTSFPINIMNREANPAWD